MPIPFPKLPDEVRKVTANYSQAAEIVAGDALTTATASVTPSGLTVGSCTVDVPNNLVTFLISSGTAGVVYTITCLALTNDSAEIGAQVQVNVTNTLLN